MPRFRTIILGALTASAAASPAWAEKCIRSEWNGFERVCVETAPDTPYDPQVTEDEQRRLQEWRQQRWERRQARREAKWLQSKEYRTRTEAWKHNNWGRDEFNAGRFGEARDLFRRAMELDDREPSYRANAIVAIIANARLDVEAANRQSDLALLSRGERQLAEAYRLDQPRLAKRVAGRATPGE